MNLPCARWIVATIALGLGVPIQDPAPTDPEALRKELQAKFDVLGPVSAKVSCEAIDAKGVTTVRSTIDIHLRFAERWMFAVTSDLDEKAPAKQGFMIYRFDEPAIGWQTGEGGFSLDMKPFMREVARIGWESDREECRLFGEPLEHKTLDEYIAKAKTHFSIDLDPDPSGAVKGNFRFALGQSKSGGVTWFKSLHKETKAEVVTGRDDVTVRETTPRRTTVIDRKTGFLRSIRLEFGTGEARVVRITSFAAGTPKPEISAPDRLKNRVSTWEGNAWPFAREFEAGMKHTLERILKQWDRLGGPDRAESFRDYFAWFGAMKKALIVEGGRALSASNFVKVVVKDDTTVDDVVRDAKAWAGRLETYVAKCEENSSDSLAKAMSELGERLQKQLQETAGPDEAKRILADRIKEGFAPERMEKRKPKRPATDFETLLREAVESARQAN